ncbi:type II secretion system protein G [Geobacter sp. OR-1]|uniref:type II secretion system protein n=1 Tax=Geobacter sp. OR-1 TaxID=1266765 RepID=UPI000541FE36|nr:type II secretion system protein GspG [Geobacter sp. OR-1]GAM07782.1 type II secretion system protein G [Geobacter sp. OR-1]
MIRNPHNGADFPIPGGNEPAPSSPGAKSLLAGVKAFTLIELIVVVAILSALAMMALPAGFNYIDKVKKARCIGDLQTISNEIQSFYIDKNRYPDSLAEINRDTFNDPWGVPYQYTNINGGGDPLLGSIDQLNPGNDYDLYSKGPDRQTNTPDYIIDSCEDDIVRASDGSFFGYRGDF